MVSSYCRFDLDHILIRLRLKFLHFYCKNKKIVPVHFLHIGKTGGTAIKYSLQSFHKVNGYSIVLHSHKVKLSDIHRGDKIFFFLRDPILRFVSAFNSRKRKGLPRYYMPWSENEKISFENFETANQLALGISSNFDDIRNKSIFAMNNIQHVKDSFWVWFENETYFRSRIDDIIFWGLQESLNEHFEIFKSIVGLPKGVVLSKDDINAHKNPQNAGSHLDEQAIKNLKFWYKKDYEFIQLCITLKPHTEICNLFE